MPEVGSGRVGEMGEGGQKAQTSSYKVSQSCGRDVQHGDKLIALPCILESC